MVVRTRLSALHRWKVFLMASIVVVCGQLGPMDVLEGKETTRLGGIGWENWTKGEEDMDMDFLSHQISIQIRLPTKAAGA